MVRGGAWGLFKPHLICQALLAPHGRPHLLGEEVEGRLGEVGGKEAGWEGKLWWECKIKKSINTYIQRCRLSATILVPSMPACYHAPC